MPTLSRWMVRAALLNVWLGFSIAAAMLSWKGVPQLISASVWRWLPAHINLLLVGWMVQLAMGVAYWIMPRLPFSVNVRGRFAWALAAAILLNGGVWLHVGAIIASTWIDWQPGFLYLQATGLILQALATLAFVIHLIPRIRPTIVES